VEQYRSWLALKQIPGVGNVLFKRLLSHFKSPEGVFSATKTELAAVEGLSETAARAIVSFRAFSEIDREFEKITKAGGALVCLHDAAYSPRLAEIYDPPPLLYMKGVPAPPVSYPVAVVGTRQTTPYGRAVTAQFCRELVRQGVSVVSGFARGIDAVAHQSTLTAGGYTLAVLGCGIDRVYPPEHKKLYHDLAERGLLLSEFAMGTPPEPHRFPQRNRIISGLSLGCVVVEAAEQSGSLITARHALEQGREVFAVPGPIFSVSSAESNRLIQSGAKLVTCVADILTEIVPQYTGKQEAPREVPPLEADEAALYRFLSSEPKQIDQIIGESGQTAAAVSGLLLTLEIKGIVEKLPGQFYTRK
jgi:DNA processing protein